MAIFRPMLMFFTWIKCFENQHPLVEVSVRSEVAEKEMNLKYVRYGHVSIVEEHRLPVRPLLSLLSD